MAIKHLTTAEFASLTQAAPLAMVDFWASWCGPCKMLSPTVEAIAQEYDGKVLVGKVNVDEEPELARQFGVSLVTIRKDLTYLESSGQLVRTHGGAIAAASKTDKKQTRSRMCRARVRHRKQPSRITSCSSSSQRP